MSNAEDCRAVIAQLENALNARGVQIDPLRGSVAPKGSPKSLKRATREYGNAFWDFEMGRHSMARQIAQAALDGLDPLPLRYPG